MPRIEPEPGSPVVWPADEGVLGVVGVAPWATIDFLNAFFALVEAEKDWDYPRVIVDNNTKIPSRGRHLQLGERDPSPYIAETLRELAAGGATAAVVVCNTAHILADRWGVDAPLPIVDIIDSTVAELAASGASTAAVLASGSLAASGLYHRRIEAAGIPAPALPPELQQAVGGIIERVKQHGPVDAAGDADVAALVAHLLDEERDAVVLGCTELSGLAAHFRAAGLTVVDSNAALAAAALRAIRPSDTLRSS